jgi:hypothetical protein
VRGRGWRARCCAGRWAAVRPYALADQPVEVALGHRRGLSRGRGQDADRLDQFAAQGVDAAVGPAYRGTAQQHQPCLWGGVGSQHLRALGERAGVQRHAAHIEAKIQRRVADLAAADAAQGAGATRLALDFQRDLVAGQGVEGAGAVAGIEGGIALHQA